MNEEPIISKPRALPRMLRAALTFTPLPAFLLLVSIQSSHAGSATWKANPSSADWNDAANWTPMTVPNGPNDTATFATSSQTNISISANMEVNGIVFNSGASAFTISVVGSPFIIFTLSGVGITNNSGIVQNFVSAVNGFDRGLIYFTHTATAGTSTVFTADGGEGEGGGEINFLNHSTAGNGTFINNGAPQFSLGGRTFLSENSRAGDAIFIANGGPGSGTGGSIGFGSTNRNEARVKIFGNGTLSTGFSNVAIGSLEGNGTVFLRYTTLTIGSNNLDTTFKGRFDDISSILIKVGTGTLTLTDGSTYANINRGKLLVNRTIPKNAFLAVKVNGGRLGGTGSLAQDVTIGDGSDRRAFLSAGKSQSNPGTLTMHNLRFDSDATYKVHVDSGTGKADKAVANRVTINGAQFAFTDLGNGTFPIGTVFTVIDNTSSAAPIAGTFTNLADGAVFTSKANTYQVDYEGGTGNDLTLTVVP